MKNFVLIVLIFKSILSFTQSHTTNSFKESFNDNWKFERFGEHPEKPGKIIEEPEGIESIKYNDKNWRNLSLPHDWGIEGPFRDDLENNTGLLPWKGIGWCRKHFVVSETDNDKQFFIDFDGAMANSKVWLNGQYVGEWQYGYTSFRFDLTPYLKFGAENIISVRLDTENLDSRWYPGAGIYRNVWLTKTNSVHIDHWGIYLTTPMISKDEALIDLRVNLKNSGKQSSDIKVQTIIFNAENKKVAESQIVPASLRAQSDFTLRFDIKVENPELWDIEHPVLYQAITRVYNTE